MIKVEGGRLSRLIKVCSSLSSSGVPWFWSPFVNFPLLSRFMFYYIFFQWTEFYCVQCFFSILKMQSVNETPLLCFLFGVVTTEIIVFLMEGGLSSDYPLSRALFYMLFSSLAALCVLLIPKLLKIDTKLANIETRLDSLEERMRPTNK